MNKSFNRLILSVSASLLFSGCHMQIRELKSDNAMLEQRVLQYQQDYESSEAQIRALQEKIAGLNATVSEKERDIASLKEREAATRRVMTEAQQSQAEALVDDMQERVERENELRLELDGIAAKLETAENDKRLFESQLQESRILTEELLAKLEESADRIDGMAQQAEDLRGERDDARAERDDFRRQLQAAEAGTEEAAAQMEELSSNLRDREKELAAAERELAEMKAQIAEKSRLDEEAVAARNDFNASLAEIFSNSAGLEVVAGDRPKVIMVSDTLFQPGTVLLSDEGLQLMEAVVPELEKRQWSELIVEGHTDNTPVRSMPFVDNWDLAAARASTVARWLAARPGISARSITATSHAYFEPRATNDTAEGRRKNRRVEIVIVP